MSHINYLMIIANFLCIFNMVRGKLMIAISTIYCEIALIFNYLFILEKPKSKLYNYICKSFI